MTTRRKTYAEVKQYFRERGYTLISTEYRNNKQRLEYTCPSHSDTIQTTRLNDLLGGHGCKLCGRERSDDNMRAQAKSQRLSYKGIKIEIEKEGFQLLSKTYVNAKESLEIQCPKHKNVILKVRIGDFRANVYKCRICAIDAMRTPFFKVKSDFEELGYTLLEEEYENSRIPLKYLCRNHPEEVSEITYGSIVAGHRCMKCAIESNSGENSVHYNFDLSDEERNMDRRYDAEHHKWRVEIFKRDAYTCQYCGIYEKTRINAHHKDGYHWCLERRYDRTNGITLCESCHKAFHTEYGYGNNTEAQYDEWMTQEQRKESAK